MTVKHSPTPWREPAGASHEIASDMNLIATVAQATNGNANRARIIACVNACEGIPTVALAELGDMGLWNVLTSCLHQLSTDSDLDTIVGRPKYEALVADLREALGL